MEPLIEWLLYRYSQSFKVMTILNYTNNKTSTHWSNYFFIQYTLNPQKLFNLWIMEFFFDYLLIYMLIFIHSIAYSQEWFSI